MKKLHDGMIVSSDTATYIRNGKEFILTKEMEKRREADELKWKNEEKQKLEILNKINELEAQITIRRLREAILNIDGGWLEKQQSLIINERKKLNGGV